MPNYNPIGEAIKALVNANITSKTAINSITPLDVGGSIDAFVDAIIPLLNTISEFAVLGGTIPPVNSQGNDLDRYFEIGVSGFKVYTKRSGAWQYDAGGNIGLTYIDGNISLHPSVSGMTITVSAGQWIRNNVRYATTSQEQFTITAADANFDRIDLVYASDDETVTYQAGTASSSPTPPSIPSDAILVTYVNVPSAASGVAPYLFDSNEQNVFQVKLTAGSGNPSDSNGKDGDIYLKNTGCCIIILSKVWRCLGGSITDFAGGGGGSFVDLGYACSDEVSDLTTGTKIEDRAPYKYQITSILANVNTAPSGSTIVIDIKKNGTSIFSTKLSIDSGETSSTTASTPYALSSDTFEFVDDLEIVIDQVGLTTAGTGLKVRLLGNKI